MKKIQISPELKSIIQKFKRKNNLSEEGHVELDKIIEFAFTEGSITGQYSLYNEDVKAK